MKKSKKTNNCHNIPVVIFCGGMGSRMEQDIPKPMVPVGGRPLLWHIMKIYGYYGFRNFIITLGYKGDYIREYFKNDPGQIFAEFKTELVETGLDTPHGGRLLRCLDYLTSSTFMVTYGDGVSDININKLLDFHYQKGGIGTLTGVHIPHRFGILDYRKDGQLLHYQKNHPMKETAFGGFMVFERPFLNYLNDSMMIEDPFNEVAKKESFFVYDHKGYWFGVDTQKDLKIINEQWRADRPWAVWEK